VQPQRGGNWKLNIGREIASATAFARLAERAVLRRSTIGGPGCRLDEIKPRFAWRDMPIINSARPLAEALMQFVKQRLVKSIRDGIAWETGSLRSAQRA
jgi:hypothetical protein